MSKKILLVDDDPRNLSLLERYLRPEGYDLSCATDGYAALALFESSAPDLILLDYQMPGLDGIDVLAHIRASGARAHTPVVLVTAHADRAHRLHGSEAGADEFLEKPIDQPILLARVATLLALKASRDELQASRDELKARHAALEDAQREQRDLMVFIVHDLKAPLTIFHLAIEWLGDHFSAAGTDVVETIADALDASTRLRAMISDLLAISRLEQPTLTLQRESIDLGPLISSVARSYVRRAEESEIALVVPAGLAALRIDGDRLLLQRVLENILDNAFRYTPRHGRIAIAATSSPGIEIGISNDGPAIPPVARRRIFEKFNRGDDGGRGSGNAGLGLYFCKRAVEAHGGAINVCQTPEWPTTFLIQLPS